MKNKFYVFGSENSTDYDVLVIVNEIPKNIDQAHEICKKWNEHLEKILIGKPLNCNIGVIKNGKLVSCFKGTADELNNVIFYTYKNHKQFFENSIDGPIKRDIQEKAIRIARFIISFYSRTHLRTDIKTALRGTMQERLNVLRKINFVEMTEFPKKKERKQDIYKVIAFQLGQIFSLIDGHEPESYTKNEIARNYPQLSNSLNRQAITKNDLEILNQELMRFIVWCEINIDPTSKESL